MRYPWATAGPGQATSGRPTLQTSSNRRYSNRLTRAPVTNVVNLSRKIIVFGEKALGLTTFVTPGQKSTQKTPWIDDTCNNTHQATRQRHSAAGVKGAGGTGGHGRASRRGAERSEALASRAAGPSGAQNTRGTTSNTINEASRRTKPTISTPGSTGVKGAGGTGGHGCGARGRRRGLAGVRGDAPSNISDQAPQAPPDWRPPRGLRGLAGLRDDAFSHTSATQPHWCGGRRRDRRARAGFEARRRTK